MTAPMTHPLTPREKVFVSASCDGERCHCGAPAVRKVGEEISYDDPNPRRHNLTTYVCARHFAEMMGPAGAQSVGYTALASGSGDHAELILMANAALEIYSDDVLVVGGTRRIHADNIILYVKNGVDALLAENAALRSQHETDMDEMARAGQNLQSQRLALTEAERKLAEADKQITMDDVRLAAGEGVLGASTVLAAVNAILRTRSRTFLSKEAERG